jgi:hypothetical protein
MKKEDIESAARMLSEIKDSLDELESAIKASDKGKATAAKVKIINLQSKIKELI